MPQIINPYLWGLFVIGLFSWDKDKKIRALKLSTIFMVLMTLFVTSATIPFLRYIHPIIPLVYLFAISTLIKIFDSDFLLPNGFLLFNFRITKQKLSFFVLSFLILFLSVGQTLGVIFLDSRFERKAKNFGKPPVYIQLSQVLRDNTDKNDIIVTNLDAWGSWYGERRTVWFPLEPNQLINQGTGKIPFDAIYLTSYLMDDENYYMGDSWRQIFFNPYEPDKWVCKGCDTIREKFELKGVYEIPASENYQNQYAAAVLLLKR